MRGPVVFLFAFSLGATEIPQGSHVLLKMVNSISTRTAATSPTPSLISTGCRRTAAR